MKRGYLVNTYWIMIKDSDYHAMDVFRFLFRNFPVAFKFHMNTALTEKLVSWIDTDRYDLIFDVFGEGFLYGLLTYFETIDMFHPKADLVQYTLEAMKIDITKLW